MWDERSGHGQPVRNSIQAGLRPLLRDLPKSNTGGLRCSRPQAEGACGRECQTEEGGDRKKLVRPAVGREAASHLRRVYGVNQRRVC